MGQRYSVDMITGNVQTGTESQARYMAADVDKSGHPALECHPLMYIVVTSMEQFILALSSRKRAAAAITGSSRGLL